MWFWNVMICFSVNDHLCTIADIEVSAIRHCGYGVFFFFSQLPLTSLLTQSRKIREDLHTIRRPLASGFLSLSLSLSWVCSVLSDPMRCVDGRLNVHSNGKGQKCLTSHSHTASLANRGLFVPQQSTRWTVQDNCIWTITVSCLFECVQSLWDKMLDECVCVEVRQGRRLEWLCLNHSLCSFSFSVSVCYEWVNEPDERFLKQFQTVSCHPLLRTRQWSHNLTDTILQDLLLNSESRRKHSRKTKSIWMTEREAEWQHLNFYRLQMHISCHDIIFLSSRCNVLKCERASAWSKKCACS